MICSIYWNSDKRIKKYTHLLDFIKHNLMEVDNLINNQSHISSMNEEINDSELKVSEVLNKCSNINRRSSTSKEIENLANKIRKDIRILSSLSNISVNFARKSGESFHKKLLKSNGLLKENYLFDKSKFNLVELYEKEEIKDKIQNIDNFSKSFILSSQESDLKDFLDGSSICSFFKEHNELNSLDEDQFSENPGNIDIKILPTKKQNYFLNNLGPYEEVPKRKSSRSSINTYKVSLNNIIHIPKGNYNDNLVNKFNAKSNKNRKDSLGESTKGSKCLFI